MSAENIELNRALAKTRSVLTEFDLKLHELIEREQFLNDLVPKSSSTSSVKHSPIPTNKSVVNALELHFGQAMNLTLLRGDGVRLPLVVPINACVLELQRTVQEAITTYLNHLQSSSNSHFTTVTESMDNAKSSKTTHFATSPEFISWRNVWKTKCLAVVNPHSRLPPLGNPSIITRLDVPENRLQEFYNLRNGALITFVRRLKRK